MGSLSQLSKFDAAFEPWAPEDVSPLHRNYTLFHQKLEPTSAWLKGNTARNWASSVLIIAVAMAATFFVIRCYNALSRKSYQRKNVPNRRRLATPSGSEVR